MDELVPFDSGEYRFFLGVLLFARGMDFLSTWVATPHLVLEGNPIARRLGWRYGIPVNLALCFGFAFWPLPATVISTTSLLVAARNFQSAWLMRMMGEQGYRRWYMDQLSQADLPVYLWCLAGNTGLTALVGLALAAFSDPFGPHPHLAPFGIGLGIIAYGIAVALFTLLGVWRLRKAIRLEKEIRLAFEPAVSHPCGAVGTPAKPAPADAGPRSNPDPVQPV